MKLRVHVHQNNPSLYALSKTDALDQALQPLGASVEWINQPFSRSETGLMDLTALSRSEIDVIGTGITPPIGGQSTGVPLVYLGHSEPRPDHGALVVRNDTGIGGAGDLAGKRIAIAVGSWQTHLAAAVLEEAGLTFGDVTIETSGAHSAERLRDGEIAAWVAQGPSLVAAEEADDLQVLIRAEEFITNRSIWFARAALAHEDPELVGAVAVAIDAIHRWVPTHVRELAAISAADTGETPEHWERWLGRLPWSIEAPAPEWIVEQQQAADLLHRAGFLGRRVDIAEAVDPKLNATVTSALDKARALGGLQPQLLSLA